KRWSFIGLKPQRLVAEFSEWREQRFGRGLGGFGVLLPVGPVAASQGRKLSANLDQSVGAPKRCKLLHEAPECIRGSLDQTRQRHQRHTRVSVAPCDPVTQRRAKCRVPSVQQYPPQQVLVAASQSGLKSALHLFRVRTLFVDLVPEQAKPIEQQPSGM